MKKFDRSIESFIKEFVKALNEHNAAIFLGAGVSKSAGCVDWKGLLKDIADELNLDIDQEHDLISLAQYHVNENGQNRSKINQTLITEFMQDVSLTETHKILASLPLHTYWTTNYDQLMETALRQSGKIIDTKHSVNQFPVDVPKRDAVIYKMHGDVSLPSDAVLTKEDYEDYNSKRGIFTTALQGQLVSKTFLWIGFSFSDPNLDYILSRVRHDFGKNQRNHFALFKKANKCDYKDESRFAYDEVKQKLMINDLRRYGIKAVMIDEYSDIPLILEAVKKQYEAEVKKKTVFISGSAAEYGNLSEKEAGDFIHNLGKRLVEEGYTIVSGFGLGVGGFIINGALEAIFDDQHPRRFEDYLILRPFPQVESGSISLKDLWDQYRRKMIPLASFAIFLFGNKKVGSEIVLANGVRTEFEIAGEYQLKIIPIGCTGYITKAIAEEVIAKPHLAGLTESEIPILEELNRGDLTTTELIEVTIRLLNNLTK